MCYTISSKQTKALLCLCFALISYPTQTCGEIQFFNILADGGTVHYSGEYLENPGSVDLTALTYILDTTSYSQSFGGLDDDGDNSKNDDDVYDNGDDMTDEEARKHSDTSSPTTTLTEAPTNSPVISTSSPTASTSSPVALTNSPTAFPFSTVAAELLTPENVTEPGSSEIISEPEAPTNSPVISTSSPTASTSSPVALTNSPTAFPFSTVAAELLIPENVTEPGSSEIISEPDNVDGWYSSSKDESESESESEDKDEDEDEASESESEDRYDENENEDEASESESEDGYGYDEKDEYDDEYDNEYEPKSEDYDYSGDESVDEDGESSENIPAKSGESEDSHDDTGPDRELEGSPPGSYIDIIFFNEPQSCVNNKLGCDWLELGIGIIDKDGARYCCSSADAERGICEKGRMIVDSDKFEGGNRIGEHRIVLVPLTGDIARVEDPILETRNGSGKYTLAMALCSDDSRVKVQIDGQVTWKSKHGLLPAELFDEYCFSAVITAVYFILMVWYAWSMWMHRDSSIGIQIWILVTIILGLVVMVLKVADFTLWNLTGVRQQNVAYAWIAFGGLEGSISRCLLVMVSLGWGVVRDTIGHKMKQIVFAGLIYASLSFGVEAVAIYLQKDVHEINEDTEISPIKLVLSFAVALMELVFYIWILDSLNGTMQYLENMNQSMKLKRYLRLRFILLISILFAMIVVVYTLVNNRFEGSVIGDGQEWATAAAWDANYIFILIGVAVLWRPNPNAKQFAYVIELPTTGGGGDLTFDTSIDSVDEDGQGDQIAYRDVQNDHFKIDDAEAS